MKVELTSILLHVSNPWPSDRQANVITTLLTSRPVWSNIHWVTNKTSHDKSEVSQSVSTNIHLENYKVKIRFHTEQWPPTLAAWLIFGKPPTGSTFVTRFRRIVCAIRSTRYMTRCKNTTKFKALDSYKLDKVSNKIKSHPPDKLIDYRSWYIGLHITEYNIFYFHIMYQNSACIKYIG